MLQENNNKTSELRLVNRSKLSLTSVEKILGTSDNRITAIVAGDTICIIGNNFCLSIYIFPLERYSLIFKKNHNRN